MQLAVAIALSVALSAGSGAEPAPTGAATAPPPDCADAKDQMDLASQPLHQCIGQRTLDLIGSGKADDVIAKEVTGTCRAYQAPMKVVARRCMTATSEQIDASLDDISSDRSLQTLVMARDDPWSAWTRWSQTACRHDRKAYHETVAADQDCATEQFNAIGLGKHAPAQVAAGVVGACAKPRLAVRDILTTCFGAAKAEALMPSFDLFVQEWVLQPVLGDELDRTPEPTSLQDGNFESARTHYLACVSVRARAAAQAGRDRPTAHAEAERICLPEHRTLEYGLKYVARLLDRTPADTAKSLHAIDVSSQVFADREITAVGAENELGPPGPQ